MTNRIQERRGPRTTRALVALACAVVTGLLTVSGCAYNYAGQNAEADEEEDKAKEPNVVEVRESDDEDEASTNEASGDDDSTGANGSTTGDSSGSNGSESSEPESPCGVQSFDVHYFDSSTQVTKKIDCARRQVTSINRSPIGQSKLRSAEQSGLPEGTWYVLVDPKGIRSKFLTNKQLIKISQEFDIRFLGRDESRNLLIYEYRGDL